MRKIVDYKIILNSGQRDIVDAVRQAIKDGWEPIGGVSLGDGYFAQAVVKYDQQA